MENIHNTYDDLYLPVVTDERFDNTSTKEVIC
ncbi:hypothetical protein [Maribacter antarcticus]